MLVRANRSVSESAAAPGAEGAGGIDACRRRLLKERPPRASRVTHVLLFLGIAAVCNASSGFAQATLTFTTHDPRQDPDITEREWGARLRNFRTPLSGAEALAKETPLSAEGLCVGGCPPKSGSRRTKEDQPMSQKLAKRAKLFGQSRSLCFLCALLFKCLGFR